MPRKGQSTPPEELFWAKVDTSGECWEWTAGLTAKGYGKFNVKKKRILAHRFSFNLHKGEIPDGLFVCHTCDNRKCVNPSHLWLGTANDNVQDMIAKGREKNPWVDFQKSKTHCKHGHPFSGKNLKIGGNGVRQCKTCQSIRGRKQREKNNPNITFRERGRKDYLNENFSPPTSCIRGHEYTSENTFYSTKGHRGCRTCKNLLRNMKYVKKTRKKKSDMLQAINNPVVKQIDVVTETRAISVQYDLFQMLLPDTKKCA